MQLFLPILLVAVSFAAPQDPHQSAILSSHHQQNPDGSYSNSYSTQDGIKSSETGYLSRTNDGTDYVVEKQGSVSYPSPDGTQIQITYIANKYGTKVYGNHLPQPVQPIAPTF